MSEDISTFTDEQLRAAIAAEVMGWTNIRDGEISIEGTLVRGPIGSPPGWPAVTNSVYFYESDANAVREVEAEIARRGLKSEYCGALLFFLGLSPLDISRGNSWFSFVASAPRQRCEAALAAVRHP